MTAERPARKFPLALGRLGGAAKAKPAATRLSGSAGPALIRPQRHVAAAHADASRRTPAVGLGLDSADVRARMVERLRGDGVAQPRVLAAFAAVPRHLFVDAGLATQAYEDTSLPIGHGQTISKPSVVARMLELLLGGAGAAAAGDLGVVLEIGTGCGYQAALLCRLARRVVSVERLKPLHDRARELLAPMRDNRLRLVFGDGMRGHPPGAPYDSIIAAAGGSEIPQAWLDQLAIGGRLVSPVQQAGGGQVLVVVDRHEDRYTRCVHEAVKFVPLKSGLAG
jgi:protein-L-isoaspartate(D-aspartate) O-methyltransferase